jgi:hypothetical protein
MAQNYRNHARYVPLYHFVLWALLLWNVTARTMDVFARPSRTAWLDLGVAIALALTAWYARAFALRAQDRVIRLEMRLRLRELLEPALLARAATLTPGQLVALRFAGDAELPGLVSEVLDGRLVAAADIKRRIQDWQADELRV